MTVEALEFRLQVVVDCCHGDFAFFMHVCSYSSRQYIKLGEYTL